MDHTRNDLFVEDSPKERMETCAGCGMRGSPHSPLRWKIKDTLGGFRDDLYCDVCHLEFRKTEYAEEAVIRAIKNAGLHEIFTLKELQRAMDGVCGVEPEWFAEAIDQGHHNLIQSRSDSELQDAYGLLVAQGRSSKGEASEDRHVA